MSASRPLYGGPIIDAHHHFWDLSGGRYPWLTNPEAAIPALGDIGFLRCDYLPQDYAADIAGQGVAASVHVEAVWDPARSPVEETAWLDALPRPPGIAACYVVAAPLAAPDVSALLDGHAASPRVAAVRETIRWHPDPAKRWTRQGLVREPAWRRGLAQLGRHGWALDLLINPHQAEEVAVLARDVPSQQFIVNHCGTPGDRDAEGLARWRAGLRAMGRQPNIAIKLSNYAAYATERTFEADRDTLRTLHRRLRPRPLHVRQRLPRGPAQHGLRRALHPLSRGRGRVRTCGPARPILRHRVPPVWDRAVTPEPLAFISTADLAGLLRGKSIPLAELPKRMGHGVGIAPSNLMLSVFGPIHDTPFGTASDLTGS